MFHQKSAMPKITLADLAAKLDLDKSSISLALRGSPKVSETTRNRVIAMAKELGYRPNLAARQLATQSSNLIALVLPPTVAPLSQGVAVMAIQCLAKEAADGGMLFNILSSDQLMQAAQSHAMPVQSDGVLVWGDVPAHVTMAIQTLGRPTVVVDPNALSYTSYPGTTVAIDNAGGAARIVEHLMQQGTQRLLFVLGDREHLGQHQRWTNARQTWLTQNPLESLLFCHKEELTDQLISDLAASGDAAIFCSNDLCALHVWHRIHQLSIRVPEQLLLAGFDAEISSNLLGLTSAIFDAQALAKTAFNTLLKRLKDRSAPDEQIVIPVDIRIGDTTRRHPIQAS